jgi:hypothetical protein
VSTNGPIIDVERFVGVFLEEAAEHVGTLETGLLRLETEPDNRELGRGPSVSPRWRG